MLNWTTCTACPGLHQRAAARERAIRGSYRDRYGDLPFNAWAMHTYGLDWLSLPHTNAPGDVAQITAARTWLDANGIDLPYLAMEFGADGAIHAIEWVPQTD